MDHSPFLDSLESRQQNVAKSSRFLLVLRFWSSSVTPVSFISPLSISAEIQLNRGASWTRTGCLSASDSSSPDY
jgi:hypothetical protein